MKKSENMHPVLRWVMEADFIKSRNMHPMDRGKMYAYFRSLKKMRTFSFIGEDA